MLLFATTGTGAAQATERGNPLRVTALSVTPDSVDATSDDATVDINWTVADVNAAATDMTGHVTVQQVAADGRPKGAPHDISFSFQPRWPYEVDPTGGTIAKAEYSHAFRVPQYSDAPDARWAVVRFTAEDDQGGRLALGWKKLARFGADFEARALVDTTGPGHDSLALQRDEQDYGYNAETSVTKRYRINVTDAESGFHEGKITLRGSGGGTVVTGFGLVTDQNGYLMCGERHAFDTKDVSCTVDVTIPAGAPAGTWSVTEVELVDAVGNVSTSAGLSEGPVHVTQNSTLSATDFSVSPEEYNNWNGVAPLTVTMRPVGAQAGITSVTVLLSCGGSVTADPVVAADGTVSVKASVPPVHTRECGVTGIGITDGAGNAAAYGAAFQGPVLDLVARQIAAGEPPVVNSARLATNTVSTASLPTRVQLTLDLKSFVGVGQFSLTIYDADRASVGGESGGLPSVPSGELVLSVPMPDGLAPGDYTVGFTLTDVAGQRSPYGYPSGNGSPVPGGPLVITVTAG
nr:hypothetical protein [Streptomyces sp. FT05W]